MKPRANSKALKEQPKNEYRKPIKMLIIGDSAIGKTNLLLKYCGESFTDNHLSTIGVDCKKKNVEIDNTIYKLQIWDTAGQERFNIITQQYYKNSMGIIMAYAINDIESFKNVEKWMEQIQLGAPENVCILLVGCKCDLYTERQVQFNQGKELAETYGIPFIETSAREDTNVDIAFLCLFKEIKGKILDLNVDLKEVSIDQQIKIRQEQNQQNECNKKKKKYQDCC